MKRILLAIEGASPREEAIRYSLGLAQRLRARLEVLQVVRPSVEKGWKRIVSRLRESGRALESTMVAATFAEAGEPSTARELHSMMQRVSNEIAQQEAAGQDSRPDYDVFLKVGDPRKEVRRFVAEHRDVVLAVYDSSDSDRESSSFDEISKELAIPTVAITKKSDRGDDEMKFSLKRKSNIEKFTETMDRHTEAVTFAEAGMPEEAVLALERGQDEASKILVVGRGHAFSQALVDYALGLAGRMGYEIVAVSSRHIPNDFLSVVAPFRDKLRQDFTEKAEEAGLRFGALAEEAGLRFSHVIKFGEGTEVLKDLHREFNKLEYVVTEPDEEASPPEGVAPAIPVFAMAMY